MFSCTRHLPKLFKQIYRNSLISTDKCIRQYASYEQKIEKETKQGNELAGSAASKYDIFVDEESQIIFDVEKEREKFYEVNDESENMRRKQSSFSGISPTRGETGVIEIDELIMILKRENAINIFVIKVPTEFSYVDHIVIASGKSSKHMRAMIEFVRKVYKFKASNSVRLPALEGRDCNDWKALDLGNIVLHVMSESARDYYDLESLWSVGSEYDYRCNVKSELEDSSYSVLSNLLPAENKQ